MLQSHPVCLVPPETARVAIAALSRSNSYIKLRDHLGTVFEVQDFVSLFPSKGQPAFAPWRLALVTVMQFAEGLSDRDASDAVRTRIDWKYLLGLKLTDSGFDHSILSRFRDRLIDGQAEMSLLQRLLEKCRDLGLVRERSDMRTDSTHVMASIRNMNRSELVGETLRATLNVLSTVDPKWLSSNVATAWYLKYARRFESGGRQSRTKDSINAAAEEVGRDGMTLLETIWSEKTPHYLRSLPAVDTLRRCWISQFYYNTMEPVPIASWRSRVRRYPDSASGQAERFAARCSSSAQSQGQTDRARGSAPRSSVCPNGGRSDHTSISPEQA
jgi:transposase